MKKSTEKSSNYNDIEKMDTLSVLENINKEDKLVALAVQKEISKIESLVDAIYPRMKDGGRLFYMGAGTSGRLGVVDASECPPTFGVDHGLVVGLIAGGDRAIRKAVENAEDDTNQGWKDLQEYKINDKDSIIGIAASGSTPYVIGAIKECNKHQILSASISCNSDSPLSQVSKHPIEVVVGPEFITGSTRMKAGTAQKLVLNMISTSLMIKLGKVVGNKMVDMQLSNNKLVDRGTKMVMEQTNLDYQQANTLLMKYGSVRNAINNHKNG
jgi:N-acetylmuramic acid 6-phosphate etherase